MILRTILSFIAAIATAVQAWLISKDGKGICFNDGCSIVERLTNVPPLYFYAFASVFFLIVFIFSVFSLVKGKEKNGLTEVVVNLFLTAAFAAEGILIFFQYSIAHTFCSVCLIVFIIIILLNGASGIWQLLRSLVVFASVVIACFSLQFEGGENGVEDIRSGTMAVYKEEGNIEDILLIFSESCSHCEEVIDFLREESFCNISFNPYEKITKPFQFEGAVFNQNYSYTATRNFMKSLGVKSFPLLMTGNSKSGIQILQGSSAIKSYLQKHCRLAENIEENAAVELGETKTDYSNGQSRMPGNNNFVRQTSGSDTCNDDSDCL